MRTPLTGKIEEAAASHKADREPMIKELRKQIRDLQSDLKKVWKAKEDLTEELKDREDFIKSIEEERDDIMGNLRDLRANLSMVREILHEISRFGVSKDLFYGGEGVEIVLPLAHVRILGDIADAT